MSNTISVRLLLTLAVVRTAKRSRTLPLTELNFDNLFNRMPGVLSALCLLSLMLYSSAAGACECSTSFSTCNEVKASDLIFIGTIESIEPLFLNRWYGTDQSAVKSVNEAYFEAQLHPSDNTLGQLKDTYIATFPGMEPEERKLVQAAKTVQEISSLFYSSLDRGMRVRLKVGTFFKHGADGDRKENASSVNSGPTASRDKEEKEEAGFQDVWTTSGDCAYDFQIGETYLVYANEEEGSGYFFTSGCMRTKRLSDAGEDLSYLYFYKNQPAKSARLEGFATSERRSQLAVDPIHDVAAIPSPVSGVVVQLRSDQLTRYAETASNGRFVFDGLPPGAYQISVLASGYPRTNHLLSGPQGCESKSKAAPTRFWSC
jgi:hypothetical protein